MRGRSFALSFDMSGASAAALTPALIQIKIDGQRLLLPVLNELFVAELPVLPKLQHRQQHDRRAEDEVPVAPSAPASA